MRYLHKMIIHNIIYMIGRVSVWLHEHLIIKDTVIEYDSAMNKIFPLTDSMWHQHSDHVGLPTLHTFINLTLAEVEAKAIVLCRLMLFSSLLQTKLLQSICWAKAVISFTFLKQIKKNEDYI
jgi:hypothetical protein